jgi:hypothetical protein
MFKSLSLNLVLLTIACYYQYADANDCDFHTPVKEDTGIFCCKNGGKLEGCDIQSQYGSCEYRGESGSYYFCNLIPILQSVTELSRVNESVKFGLDGGGSVCPGSSSIVVKRNLRAYNEDHLVSLIFKRASEMYQQRIQRGEIPKDMLEDFKQDRDSFLENYREARDYYPLMIGASHMASIAANLASVFGTRRGSHPTCDMQGEKKHQFLIFDGKGYPVDLFQKVVEYARADFGDGNLIMPSDSVTRKHLAAVRSYAGQDFTEKFRRTHGQSARLPIAYDLSIKYFASILEPYGCIPLEEGKEKRKVDREEGHSADQNLPSGQPEKNKLKTTKQKKQRIEEEPPSQKDQAGDTHQ